MSLRNKINKLSSLLDNEREKNEKFDQERKKLERIISKKSNNIDQLQRKLKNFEHVKNEVESLKKKIKDIQSNQKKFKHFSYVCSFCRTVNIVNTYNSQNEYKFSCKKCSELNEFTFNFDYLYVLASKHSNLLKIGYSERNPYERIPEINRATGSLVWELFAYHKTFTGRKIEVAVFDCLRNYRVDSKEFFELSFDEVEKRLNEDLSLQLIKTHNS